MVAIGLAIFLPAMSGAEPCTGSKIEGPRLRSGLMLPEAAMPIVPAVAGPRSEMMSPNRLLATLVVGDREVRCIRVDEEQPPRRQHVQDRAHARPVLRQPR